MANIVNCAKRNVDHAIEYRENGIVKSNAIIVETELPKHVNQFTKEHIGVKLLKSLQDPVLMNG